MREYGILRIRRAQVGVGGATAGEIDRSRHVLELREPDLPWWESVQLHHVFRELVREDIVYEH